MVFFFLVRFSGNFLFFFFVIFFFFTVFPHLICPLFLFLLSPLRVFVPFFTCVFFIVFPPHSFCLVSFFCLLTHFYIPLLLPPISSSSISSSSSILSPAFYSCFIIMFSYPFHSFSPLPSSLHSLSLPLYSYSLFRILLYLIHFVYWSLFIFPTPLSLHSLSLPFIHPLCFLLRFHQPCL